MVDDGTAEMKSTRFLWVGFSDNVLIALGYMLLMHIDGLLQDYSNYSTLKYTPCTTV